MAREPQPRRPVLTGSPEEQATQMRGFVDDLLRYLDAQPRTEIVQCECIGGSAFRVRVDSPVSPLGVIVLRAEAKGTPGAYAATTQPIWEWVRAPGEDRTEINITTLGGLTSGTAYKITLLLVGRV